MKMVDVKTDELIGPALDWAVAKAVHGVELEIFDTCCGSGNWNGNPNEPPECCGRPVKTMHLVPGPEWRPSVDWAQGGPLIDKHITALNQSGTETYWAHCEDHLGLGPTALVAACRAIVAAKLGDVVSVPAELVNGGGV